MGSGKQRTASDMTPSRTSSLSDSPEAPRARGVVLRFYPDRSFGFIHCRESALPEHVNKDFFFHATGLDDCQMIDLEEGGAVEFEPRLAAKGWRAEHITRVP